MKSFFISIAASSLFGALVMAQPQPHYTVTDLGALPGGTFASGNDISNNSFIAGQSAVADGSQHAVLWYQGRIIDISKPALLGPNSAASSINPSGRASVLAESTAKDPNGENFCGFGTGLKCLPFVWQGGLLTPLPLLGGNNGSAGYINSSGEIPGYVETGTRDPLCAPGVSVGGTGPQVLDFEAVVWGPRQGEMRVLRPLPGDTVGVALWINDAGEAVGASGTCANTVLPPLLYGPHAVLWERDGTAIDLGNLGSKTVNAGLAVNNQGSVTGASGLTDQGTVFDAHGFLWTKESGKMRDLGTLSGDHSSVGLGINDGGDVVGASIDAEGNSRAYLWRNGVMSDLNALVPAGSPLFLLWANAINSRREIVGYGATATGDVHAFLASPSDGKDSSERGEFATRALTRPVLSESGRQQWSNRFGSRGR